MYLRVDTNLHICADKLYWVWNKYSISEVVIVKHWLNAYDSFSLCSAYNESSLNKIKLFCGTSLNLSCERKTIMIKRILNVTSDKGQI